jgi:K+ transporter
VGEWQGEGGRHKIAETPVMIVRTDVSFAHGWHLDATTQTSIAAAAATADADADAASVMSAISGLEIVIPSIEPPHVVGLTIAVLVVLFSVQHYGTGRVSLAFAPVILVWLLLNAGIGFYNMHTYGWEIWQVRRVVMQWST